MIKNNINEKSGIYLKVTAIYSCGHHDRKPPLQLLNLMSCWRGYDDPMKGRSLRTDFLLIGYIYNIELQSIANDK